MTSHELTS